jgi:raffinose/stachyose/melibiose transport system substrate-binding protein
MKKTKVLFVVLAALVLLAGPVGLASAGGGGDRASTAARPVEIRYMGTETVGGALNTLFTAMLEEFNRANPDIRVQADLLPSADLRTKITVEMAAGNPPEISCCISSYASEFMRDNKIEDWRPIIAANPEFNQWYDKKNLDNLTYSDGRIMTMPTEASIDGFYYNTEIFARYGWQPPRTFDDLLDLTVKARAAGINLMVTGGRDIRFAWLASALMARTAGRAKTDALTIGNAMDQWDNPQYGFVTAMTKFKQLVDAGLYPRGVLGMNTNEADQAFARGEAAMYYEGAWKGDNFKTAGGDAFINKLERIDWPAFTDCPDGDPGLRVGGNIWGLMIPVGLDARTKDAVIRFAKAYCNPEYNAKLMETGARVFAGKCNYDRSKTMKIFNQCVDAYLSAPGYMLSMDSYAVPSVDLAIKQTAMPGIVSGEFTVAQAVAEVQKAAKDYLSSRK